MENELSEIAEQILKEIVKKQMMKYLTMKDHFRGNELFLSLTEESDLEHNSYILQEIIRGLTYKKEWIKDYRYDLFPINDVLDLLKKFEYIFMSKTGLQVQKYIKFDPLNEEDHYLDFVVDYFNKKEESFKEGLKKTFSKIVNFFKRKNKYQN